MALHKGKPSGINKSRERGTGIPSDFKVTDVKKDEKLTKKYTENDEKLAEGIRLQHPNRNVNK